jgi:exoribonuclease R
VRAPGSPDRARTLTCGFHEGSGVPQTLAETYAAIREQLHIAGPFPAAVEEAARAAAARGPVPRERADRTDLELVTIDPPGSMDLDQALYLTEHEGGLRVYYAIADIGAFVERGSVIEEEAWKRGVTAYAPDFKTPVYPPVLSEGAASLLPDGPRPAFLFTVDLDSTGESVAFSIERAMVASRRRLTYAEVQHDGMPLLEQLGSLREARAKLRGATRLELPKQEVVADPRSPCGFRLHWEERMPVEDWNADVSLLVGMGSAEQMLRNGIGLLRVMEPPDPERLAAAQAAAAHLQGVAALTVMRHAMGRARYAFFDAAPPEPVEHYALAAPYAHVTAPLRRLCDRYVLELLADGADEQLRDSLARLPETMAKAEARAGRLERELIDATEACAVGHRIGERFKAVVLAADDRGTQIQIEEPPIIARLDGSAEPGTLLEVTLVAADPATRTVTFRTDPKVSP